MNATQEPKYKIIDGRIVNRQSGEAIPDDEPLMIFRARDIHAVAAIRYYLGFVADPIHAQAVGLRLKQFQKWDEENPDRMKEPDTELTADWPGFGK